MVHEMPKLPIPDWAESALAQEIGDERAKKAVMNAHNAHDHWSTLGRILGEGPGSQEEFFLYLNTLSREEVDQVVMVGLLAEKLLLRGFIDKLRELGVNIEGLLEEEDNDEV